MEIVHTIDACRAAVAGARQAGSRIGFVPTMGALHEAHLALLDEARRLSDWVVVSVFVNPLQFAPGEDFDRYPRDLPADAVLAGSHDAATLFAPAMEEIYPRAADVVIEPGSLAGEWEGRVRPGHFQGVLTVVAKLLNIVQPDVAVFGQKDLQQAELVRAMVRDLNIPVELVVHPTVRDPDGLALSSRNRYLSPADRDRALALPHALQAIEGAYASGDRDVEVLERAGQSVLGSAPGVKIDYLAVVERDTFRRPALLQQAGAAIGAIRVGETRLIDNVLLG